MAEPSSFSGGMKTNIRPENITHEGKKNEIKWGRGRETNKQFTSKLGIKHQIHSSLNTQ